jgi:hypothetical protein
MTNLEGWLPYLKEIPWTQFATFTTSKPITLRSARRLMEKVGSRVLRPDEKLFWCAEPFQLGVREGSYHVHALLETRHSAKQVEDWYSKKYGRADVRRYDPKQGAVGYVSKYMTKSVHDYDLLVGRGEKLLEI